MTYNVQIPIWCHRFNHTMTLTLDNIGVIVTLITTASAGAAYAAKKTEFFQKMIKVIRGTATPAEIQATENAMRQSEPHEQLRLAELPRILSAAGEEDGAERLGVVVARALPNMAEFLV